MTIYPATTKLQGNTKPLEAWTKDSVPVTDGSERQMGKDSFLLLLLTQLQNQDPTSPMENEQMTAQLAQFSQLEQLQNMNDAVNTMTGYIQAQNQFQTLNMIGKDVLAESELVSVTDGKPDMNVSVITTEPCKIIAYIVDSKGNQLRKIDMGLVEEPGEHQLKWNGRDNNNNKIEDGAYALQVTATDLSGKILEDGVYPQVSGKISSVSFDASGQPVIHMGNATLNLGQVLQILANGSVEAPSFTEDDTDAANDTDAADDADAADGDSAAEEEKA